MKPLNEITVLITGASRGIGAAVAERFAREGMKVVIHYLQSHEAANETARRCVEAAGSAENIYTIAADLRSLQQLEQMQTKLEARGMVPDILVNNAGIAHYGMLCDMDELEWDNLMGINLKGMFLCTKLFMAHMVRQRYGRIINISSVWGAAGASCEVAYATSKGGMNAFTKSLAKELAPSHVTVNAVAPGAVETEMNSHLSVEEKQMLEQEIPLGRFAKTDEIASLVYFLSLPESGYITGQIISPDGGWMA